VLLAGANNSGKTALLSGLDLVVRGAVPTMPRHAAAVEPAHIRARFALSDEERNQLLQSSDRLARGRPEVLRWVELHFVEAQENAFHVLELNVSASGQAILPAAQVVVSDGPRYRFEVNRWLLEVLSGELAPRSGERVDLQTATEGSGILGLVENLAQFMPPMGPIAGFLTAWRERFYHFSALRQGTLPSYQLRSDEILTPTGENLPAVLIDLQHNRFETWERVRRLIEQIVPDVGRLDTPTQAAQMSVAFADPHVPGYRPNIKNLGTGVEQLLMTIIVGVTQPATSIVVIEEPETNLHPGAQRALLTQLREWASDRLFVLSTHSPVFLDRAPVASSVFLVERTQGTSTVRPLTNEPSDALTALGVRLSDVLSADRLLIVEGEPDREILTTWFPTLMADPRMEVVLGGGGDLARFADSFSSWLQGIDRIDGRRVLFLRDRDEVPSGVLSQLEAAPAVMFSGGENWRTTCLSRRPSLRRS
jgi:AAA ATPase domain